MPSNKRKPSLILLTLFLSAASMGAMIVTPALPQIAIKFHVSQSSAEWVISIYILGYGLGQLIHSPLSNRFGRRRILFFGVVTGFISTSIGIGLSQYHFFSLFLLTRLISALGLSAGLVLSMAMIKDSYNESDARKAFSIVVMNFAFVPFLAILAGGILTTHLGWLSTQYAILLFLFLLLMLLAVIPETLAPSKRQLTSPFVIAKNYFNLFRNKDYILLMIVYCVAVSVGYIFNVLAPIIGIKQVGVSPQHFSIFSVLTSLGFIIGASLSTRLSHRFSAERLILSGLTMTLLSSIIMLTLFLKWQINIASLFIPAITAFAGATLVTPNASMKAMSIITDHASGAAVLNTSALMITSIVLSVAGQFIVRHALVLPLSLIIMTLLGLFVLQKPSSKRIVEVCR